MLAVLTVDGNGNWQYPIPDTLTDGAHDFRVDSVDIAGNRASDILTVTVDTRAAIDIDDLDTGSILGRDNVTLSGSTSEVEAGQRVTSPSSTRVAGPSIAAAPWWAATVAGNSAAWISLASKAPTRCAPR